MMILDVKKCLWLLNVSCINALEYKEIKYVVLNKI